MFETTSEEFRQRVCQKYNTSVQQVEKDLEVLKEWIRQQPHLPQTSSDNLLINFLISCKNSMERAKEKIDNYYTVRLILPYYFTDRSFEDEEKWPSSQELIHFTLPKFTDDGCYVHMLSIATGDADKFELPVLIKRFLAYGDIFFDNQPYIAGHYLVIDCSLFNFSHLRWFTPTSSRDMFYCAQDVYPAIIKGIILFNAPSFADVGMKMVRPFMKKKLFEKFQLHSEGPEILEKYFPKKMLPRDYGGEEDTRINLHEAWLRVVKEKSDWLTTEGLVTVDEKKRIGSSNMRNNFEFQEIQGSFKALCVD